ncbi:MAG: ArnT family glycosyltransferase, partial [Actinomycetes bacterium]
MTSTTGDAASRSSGARPDDPAASRVGRSAVSDWARVHWVGLVATTASLIVLLTNVHGIALGDDGVGYRAIADSLLGGRGLGYFLERPVTIWPPLWPALMAAVAWATPLTTTGAAIVLNAATVGAAVLVGHRLLARLLQNERLVVLGTLVIAFGSSTIGFGHLLMTDFAFALVVMAWLLTLLNGRVSEQLWWPALAGVWVWVGFGLRYVAVALIGIGGLWLLLDGSRPFLRRIGRAAIYGAVAIVVPVAWMLRNHSIDGTFTGERYPSARGLVDNAFDIVATLGRFLLPGVANGVDKIWAMVGLLGLLGASVVVWKVLGAPTTVAGVDADASAAASVSLRIRRAWNVLGRPAGLLLLTAGIYLAYMLYVRSTTALNQLDLRLLNPAYFPLMALGLVVVDSAGTIDADGSTTWQRRSMTAANLWAAANITAGLAGVVLFLSGNSFFAGNYSSDTFVAVRANPALAALPANCRNYSNLPNALYPRVEAAWSPRRTGLESNAPVDDLRTIGQRLGQAPSCLIWIDQDPRYGHLWSLQKLSATYQLELLARRGDVA